MKKRTAIWIMVSCLVFVIGLLSLAIFEYYSSRDFARKMFLMDDATMRGLESQFDAEPTVRACMMLMDKYHFRGESKKVLFYGNKCFEIGADNDPRGMHVNYYMAVEYAALKDRDLARKYLRKAIELDKKGSIRENRSEWIDKQGLKAVYDSIILENDNGSGRH